MKMNRKSLADVSAWKKAGVTLPEFNIEKMICRTKDTPIWVHFGAGNIFRGFIAVLQQRLLNAGLEDRGIIVADTFDYEIISRIYEPYDCLTMNVTLNTDATISKEVIASVAEGLRADAKDERQMARLAEIFENPSLQMVSFTITEKGYALHSMSGELTSLAAADMQEGPCAARHAMSMVAALMHKRFRAGAYPIALVSMDNCSHNGEKLRSAVIGIAKAWEENGFVSGDFIAYLEDESRVSFPWSMIDKITPRPAKVVEEQLYADGIEDMTPVVTSRNTFIAPFVNSERPQYLVIEDRFPNGRPMLEKAGVYMTDRNTVNCTERMKVATCLNPLHTALAVYGCLLRYTLICEEMKDEDLHNLVTRLGYTEGLPVVVDPGIISPQSFIDEVVKERLPNVFMPDDPRRIATDTSQKVGIRFGETIKSYVAAGRGMSELVAVPLAIAGWFRYLLGLGDDGEPIEISADPMKEALQEKLMSIEFGKPETYKGQLRKIMANDVIFGLDLTRTELANKIEQMFVEEIEGPGAVRRVLKKYLSDIK